MVKKLVVFFLFFPGLCLARDVFKKYVALEEISFRDGHFRVYDKGELIKLKLLRVNNGGIYYCPKDVCKKKKPHSYHDDGYSTRAKN